MKIIKILILSLLLMIGANAFANSNPVFSGECQVWQKDKSGHGPSLTLPFRVEGLLDVDSMRYKHSDPYIIEGNDMDYDYVAGAQIWKSNGNWNVKLSFNWREQSGKYRNTRSIIKSALSGNMLALNHNFDKDDTNEIVLSCNGKVE